MIDGLITIVAATAAFTALIGVGYVLQFILRFTAYPIALVALGLLAARYIH